MPTATPRAQQPYLHLNPVIDKFARGEFVFGVSTGDISVESAHSLARADIDYVYLDMEHPSMSIEVLRTSARNCTLNPRRERRMWHAFPVLISTPRYRMPCRRYLKGV